MVDTVTILMIEYSARLSPVVAGVVPVGKVEIRAEPQTQIASG